MVTFTLLTTPGSEAFRAVLLNFDNEIRILADPAWDGVSPDDVLFMEKTLSDVDLILLSQPTPDFIGGYSMLCIKFPHLMAAIPIYATVAVSQLGRVATVEFYRSRGLLGPVLSSLLEVSDVDEWFDRITLVKYFQNMTMLENRLLLTAYNSGYSLGGAFWLITKRLQKVVYAPTWNHSKDSFLNGAGFTSVSGSTPAQLIRPTAVITSTHLGSAMSHKKRTEKFLGLVDATLANGGAVLLPISISGRFFELLQIVDTHLSNLQGAAIPVYFLSYSGTKVLSYASNLLDWMSTLLIKEYAGQSTGDQAYTRTPFNPSKVDLLLDPNELVQLPGPKIVFASGLEFRDGDLSSKTLDYICRDEKTTIILTERAASTTDNQNNIAADLYSEWYKLAAAKNNGVAEDGIPVPLEKAFHLNGWTIEEPLPPDELKEYTERVTLSRRQKLMEKVRDKKNKNILNAEEDSSSSSDEDDSSDEEQLITNTIEASALPASAPANPGAAAAINTLDVFVTDYVLESLAANKPVDFKVLSKMRPKQAMFPFIDASKKRKFDDYGEVIDIKQFRHTDEAAANSKLIDDSRRKFDDERGDDGRPGRRFDRNKQANKDNKLTPQEALNNELLQKYLDSLHQPLKRVVIPPEANAAIRVRCGLSFVDLAGLVDLRSLSTILSSLRPRNLVLLPDITYNKSFDDSLNGQRLVQAVFQKQIKEQKFSPDAESESASAHFDLLLHARSASSAGPTNELKVFVPEDNLPIQVGGDSLGRNSEFEVQLNDELSTALSWQKLQGHYKITHVRGELGVYESKKGHKEHDGKSTDELDSPNSLPQLLLKPILGPLTVSGAARSTHDQKPTSFGSTLAIGNVRLTELRKKLLSLNMNAEFKGEGVLVVNNEVSVQKLATDNSQSDDTGDILVDGQIGPLYYQVKKCIREMLAFV